MRLANMKDAIHTVRYSLTNAKTVNSAMWQGKEVGMDFLELLNVSISAKMKPTIQGAVEQCNPDLPWADQHFEERVCGKPLNPPPSHVNWKAGTEKYLTEDQEKFSHSYPERMWSKGLHTGIRYNIADLNTLVDVLVKDPGTRQAYLPMFFPEDLSASLISERVPCTLGWHFMIRDNYVHCHYPMRSCDAVRHLHNDVYLANRLVLWVIERMQDSGIQGLKPGELFMNVTSMHCFANDMYTLKKMTGQK